MKKSLIGVFVFLLVGMCYSGFFSYEKIEQGQTFLQINAVLGKINESKFETNQAAFENLGVKFQYESSSKITGQYSWLPSITFGFQQNRQLAYWLQYEMNRYKASGDFESYLAADAPLPAQYNNIWLSDYFKLSSIDYKGILLGAQYSLFTSNKYIDPYLKAGAGVSLLKYSYLYETDVPFKYDTAQAFGSIKAIRKRASVEANEALFGGYVGLGFDILIYKFLKMNLEASYQMGQSANSSPQEGYSISTKLDPNKYIFNQGLFSIDRFCTRMGFKFLIF